MGKEEWKEEEKGKRRKYSSFIFLDIGKKGKKKMSASYLSFVWFAKRRKRKNAYFYLCALINDG